MLRQFEFKFERIEQEILHEGKKLTFVLPTRIQGTYAEVKKDIENQGLRTPTFAEMVSLVDFFITKRYSKNNPKYFKDFEKEYTNSLLGFTGILYLPRGQGNYHNGVIIQDNPPLIEGRIIMNKPDLLQKLEKGDKSTRFVPYGYKTHDYDLRKGIGLEKHPLIVGIAGEEGAEKLAKISKRYGDGDSSGVEVLALDGEKQNKEEICYTSIRENETEHNQNNPWYSYDFVINCLEYQDLKWPTLGAAPGIKII